MKEKLTCFLPQIRVDEATRKTFDEIAEIKDRPLRWVVSLAVKRFCEDYKKGNIKI